MATRLQEQEWSGDHVAYRLVMLFVSRESRSECISHRRYAPECTILHIDFQKFSGGNTPRPPLWGSTPRVRPLQCLEQIGAPGWKTVFHMRRNIFDMLKFWGIVFRLPLPRCRCPLESFYCCILLFCVQFDYYLHEQISVERFFLLVSQQACI